MRPIYAAALGGGLVGLLIAILLQQLGLLDLGPLATGPLTLALFVVVGTALFAGFGLGLERRPAAAEQGAAPMSGPGTRAEAAVPAGSLPRGSEPEGPRPPS